MENVKIIQIIPAPEDMRAVYEIDKDNAASCRIACLALVEDAAGRRFVDGMILGKNGEFVLAKSVKQF